MKSIQWNLVIPLAGLGVIGFMDAAVSHGAKLTYEVEPTISLTAAYDNGEPFNEAQVFVYSPENPQEPWETGTTDESGRYQFRPNPEIPGNWTVTVRQAGHGDMITINLDDSTLMADDSTGDAANSSLLADLTDISVPQRLLTGASVIWGCVGTALYFSRGHKSSSSDS
ncbi:MAG: carboxypeptidase-like regulatory domain-containing protein [Sodalinema sp.]|uniref:carboxypeptidase-like regulatory domain-containing protein n=1 Tax=Sodalinema sp. TaxID=3080550 RepID=UPI0011F45F0C|nr:MAG: carboxypeptidase regulatory-like domain-containing protein [Phormidium sp. SL48-SHIP]